MEQVTESRRKPIVVGIGELLWDMLPSGKKAGGAPINFVYHASCLGAEGYAISAVGDDELGKEIVDELDKNHIQHLIEKVPYPTGTVQVELREGIPTYTIHERVARQRYYDKELIEESLYLANVLKVNDEEFNVLRDLFGLNGTEREVALWFIEKYGLRMFVLTAGSSHSTIYTREEISTLPTPEVTVADTVGAGDAFSGALSEAHHFAVKTAAFVCTKEGAWPVYEE